MLLGTDVEAKIRSALVHENRGLCFIWPGTGSPNDFVAQVAALRDRYGRSLGLFTAADPETCPDGCLALFDFLVARPALTGPGDLADQLDVWLKSTSVTMVLDPIAPWRQRGLVITAEELDRMHKTAAASARVLVFAPGDRFTPGRTLLEAQWLDLEVAGIVDMGPLPMISVVVPARDEEAHIGRCLSAFLQRQTYPTAHIEVVVADGGSTDGTRSIVDSFPGARVVENLKRTTPYGLNMGIQSTTGDVVIIFSAHAVPDDDFVHQNVIALVKTGAAAVGGVHFDTSTSTFGQIVGAVLNHPFGVGNARHRYSSVPGYVDTVAYGGYRRCVFERLGFFDTALTRNQDLEFNYRVRSAGMKLYFSPAIRSTYFARATPRTFVSQNFGNGLYNIVTLIRSPRSLRVRHLVPLGFVMAVCLSALAVPVTSVARWLLAAILVAYGCANAVASINCVRRRAIPSPALVPVIFLALHLSYGMGSLVGVCMSARLWKKRGLGA